MTGYWVYANKSRWTTRALHSRNTSKQHWRLQQSPDEEVFANRLAHFCKKWPHTGAYLKKQPKSKCLGDCVIVHIYTHTHTVLYMYVRCETSAVFPVHILVSFSEHIWVSSCSHTFLWHCRVIKQTKQSLSFWMCRHTGQEIQCQGNTSWGYH